jgi:hypothetical protein
VFSSVIFIVIISLNLCDRRIHSEAGTLLHEKLLLLLLFLLADDIKIFGTKFGTDGTLPQPDMDSIRGWCAANLRLTKLKS